MVSNCPSYTEIMTLLGFYLSGLKSKLHGLLQIKKYNNRFMHVCGVYYYTLAVIFQSTFVFFKGMEQAAMHEAFLLGS